MTKHTSVIFNWAVAYRGALIGVAAVFAYSIIVMLYCIIRSSATIYDIMPAAERNGIFIINGFSIAYSVSIFSILIGLFSAVGGAVTAVILKRLLLHFNNQFNNRKAMIISCIIALLLLIIIYATFYGLLKERMTFSYVETFSFWFLFPAFIFWGVVIIGGGRLNAWLNTGNMAMKSMKTNRQY